MNMNYKTIQSGFIEIDGLNQNLNDFSVDEIKSFKAVIIKNLGQIAEKDFVSFGSKFGPILPYEGGPIYSFTGEAQDEIELHYDGISASTPKKNPDWLIFYVKKASPVENGGAFKVADTETALKYISEGTRKFLRTTQLQFFGYFADQKKNKKNDEFSFEVNPIDIFMGRETLRIFLPSLEDRFIEDSKKIFKGKTLSESIEIFNDLKKALYHPDVIHRFSFSDHDVLILNNKFTFHGRERFNQPVLRTLDRIQTLAADASEFALKI